MSIRETYYSESARDEAYRDVLEKLSGQRRTVFEIILRFGPCTDKYVSHKSGIPVHLVTARRNELWGKERQPSGVYVINPDRQLIEFAGYDNSKPKQSLWRICSSRLSQPTLFE